MESYEIIKNAPNFMTYNGNHIFHYLILRKHT